MNGEVSEAYYIKNSTRVIPQYQNEELLITMQQALLAEIYELRDAILTLNRRRSVEYAEGDFLVEAGGIYNIQKSTDDEDLFRKIILATIAAKTSNGKRSNIKKVIDFLIGPNTRTQIISYEYSAIKIEIESTIPDVVKEKLAELLSLSVAGGKRVAVILQTNPNVFRFGKTWGTEFATPIDGRNSFKTMNFFVPASQSDGVLILAEQVARWKVSAKGIISVLNGQENGPLGISGSKDARLPFPVELGRLVLQRDSGPVGYSEDITIDVAKGESIVFVVNDDFHGDNLGAFSIQIEVING